jgi:hypothetical protein
VAQTAQQKKEAGPILAKILVEAIKVPPNTAGIATILADPKVKTWISTGDNAAALWKAGASAPASQAGAVKVFEQQLTLAGFPDPAAAAGASAVAGAGAAAVTSTATAGANAGAAAATGAAKTAADAAAKVKSDAAKAAAKASAVANA